MLAGGFMAYYSYDKNTTNHSNHTRFFILMLFLVALIVFAVGMYLSQKPTDVIQHASATTELSSQSSNQQAVTQRPAQDEVIQPVQSKETLTAHTDKQHSGKNSQALVLAQTNSAPKSEMTISTSQQQKATVAHESLICSVADKQSGFCN